MKVSKKILREDAVYWAPNGVDKNGRPKFADPVQIKCFWMDVQEQFIDKDGEQRLSSSKVFVPDDAGVLIDGVLMYGTLDDVPLGRANAPLTVPGARQIQGRSRLPVDLKVSSHMTYVHL